MKKFAFILVLSCISLLNIGQIQLENTTLIVESVAQDLLLPWDMVWGPDNTIWFSERVGNIKRFDLETGIVDLIYYESACDPYEEENSGMHGFNLHPQFPTVPYMYAHYPVDLFNSRIVRYVYDVNTNSITGSSIILQLGANASHNGSRIIWDNDESFFFCIGDAFTSLQYPQDPDHLNGKILRVGMNGEIPSDNPNPASYVYTLGHRNPQGLVKASNGILYSSEHGTFVDDEINIIEPSRNYGWPYSIGPCDAFDAEETEFCNAFNVREPIWWWNPTQACSGMDYYDHEAIPEWRNSLIVGFLKEAQFKVLNLSEDGLSVLSESSFLPTELGRVRDVLVSSDGSVYVCTSNREQLGVPYVTADDDQIWRIYNPDYVVSVEEEAVKAELNLFPNPADTYVNLLSPSHGLCSIEFFDGAGRVVMSEHYQNNGYLQLDTQSLESGMYIVRFTSSEGNVNTEHLFVNHR